MENNEFYSDLFNLSADDFKQEEKKGSLERYRPDAKSGKDNVYKSVIRFIPWWKEPKAKSIMQKWTCWLVDPVSGDGHYVDCPSSIGQKSLIQDVYWKLKKSESVAEQKLADHFSRRQTFASLVQIIKDDNNPQFVGKIMVFQYGIKIYNKIMAEIKPEFGKPHIPFDLFEGKPFFVNIKLVAGFNNYDECKFLDEKLPLAVDGKSVEKTSEGVEKIVNYLKENSPDLEKYGYQPWTGEIQEFVNTVIKNIVPKGKIMESIGKSNSSVSSLPKLESTQSSQSILGFKTEETRQVYHEPPKSNVPDIEDLRNSDDGELNFDDINFTQDGINEDLYDKL